MSQVLVWKSDADGKLFEDKKKYQSHLRKLARERAFEKKKQAARDARNNFIINVLGAVETIAELEQVIKDNWDWFFYNAAEREAWRLSKKDLSPHKYHKIAFDVRWQDSVSNTHSCPRDGVTNWGGKVKLADGSPAPRGYPGWHGSIVIQVVTEKYKYKNKEYYRDGFGSAYFEGTSIHTGTGSGGHEKNGISSYQYSVDLYASDFPAMWNRKKQSDNWMAMGGKELEIA